MQYRSGNDSEASAEDLAWAFLHAIQTRDWENIRPLLDDGFNLEVPFSATGIDDVSDCWRGVEIVEESFKKTWIDLVVVKYAEIEVIPGKDRNIGHL